MNSKKAFEWFFNPFTRLAGYPAFILGIIVSVLTAVTGTYSNIVFDGALDAHFREISMLQALSVSGLSLLSLIIVFWLTGLFVAKPFRFIDLMGTLTLAKAPFLFLALIAFFVTSPDAETIMAQPLIIFRYPWFIAALILSLPIIVWSVALMHNAYKTSCGLKGTVLTLSFIVALVISEGVSKILIYLIF